jgi:replication factor A1
MMSLKSGCVREMFQGNVNTPCAVQVLEVKRLSANSAAGSAPAAERFRLSISDGIHFMQAMVATQLNPRVSNEEIKKDTVIQLEDCICNLIQGRRIVIILKVEILGQPGHQIGSPVSIEDSAPSAAPAAASTAQTFQGKPVTPPTSVKVPTDSFKYSSAPPSYSGKGPIAKDA